MLNAGQQLETAGEQLVTAGQQLVDVLATAGWPENGQQCWLNPNWQGPKYVGLLHLLLKG